MRAQSSIFLILASFVSIKALANPESATLKFTLTAQVNPLYGLYVNGNSNSSLIADFGELDIPTDNISPLSITATIASNNTSILSFSLKQSPPSGVGLPENANFYMQNIADPHEIIGFNVQYFGCNGQSVTGNEYIIANVTNQFTSAEQYSMISPNNGSNNYCSQYNSVTPGSGGIGYGHFEFTIPDGQWAARGTYQTASSENALLQLTICDASACT